MQDERLYVVEIITAVVNGSGDRWAWHNFTSSSLRDAELDRIRRSAGAVGLPLDAEGRAILHDLLEQAELVGADPAKPKPWRMEAGMFGGLLVGAGLFWANYLPGAGLFHNLHLLIVPAALGAFVVALRNSRKQVGAYAPEIVAQNKQGRV